MTTTTKLLTTLELARRLDVGYAWVLRGTKEGRIPHIRVGKQCRFDWDEVCRALREDRVDRITEMLMTEGVVARILQDDDETASRARMAIVELANRITEGAR